MSRMPQRAPATPSPHRFLLGQRRPNTQDKETNSKSSLRQQVDSATVSDPPRPGPERVKVSSQFASTPRFSAARRPAQLHGRRSPSPPKAPLLQALRGPRTEDVEETPAYDYDDEMLDDEQANAVATTEDDASHWEHGLESAKRRRLEDMEPTVTPFRRPQYAASHFRDSVAPSAAPGALSDAGVIGRPTFLRPSVAPQEPSEPLPDTFSPHKRGQKFVPGGMAATVQQWVIETGQAAVQSRKGQGYLRGEDFVTRVKVDRVVGRGPFTVHGEEHDRGPKRLLLAGKMGADGEAKNVRIGDVVGARAPTWEVELDGQMWTVAVDWKILQ